MNEFEKSLLKYFSKKELDLIQGTVVGIAGAGGLGSNCAFNLVRSGIKNFFIYDFDMVEFSNLNRQFYFIEQIGMSKVEALKENLIRINPDLNISVQKVMLDNSNIKKLFADCDVIVEAFDRAESKKMIVESFLNTNKFIVSVSGLAGIGESDDITINKIRNNLFIVGDMVSEVDDKKLPYSPKVNIAAAKQADVILKWVLNR